MFAASGKLFGASPNSFTVSANLFATGFDSFAASPNSFAAVAKSFAAGFDLFAAAVGLFGDDGRLVGALGRTNGHEEPWRSAWSERPDGVGDSVEGREAFQGGTRLGGVPTAGDCGGAFRTLAVVGEPVVLHLKPVAFDQ